MDTLDVTLSDIKRLTGLRHRHARHWLDLMKALGHAKRVGFRKTPSRGRPATLWRVKRCLTISL